MAGSLSLILQGVRELQEIISLRHDAITLYKKTGDKKQCLEDLREVTRMSEDHWKKWWPDEPLPN